MQSSNLGPMAEMQADAAAAQTAQHFGLAEKARAEVEAMQRAEADRTSPAVATQYAGHAAGMTMPDASRLSQHIQGVLEQPGPGDIDDAMVVGKEAQPYPTAAPNVPDAQKRLFQSALAATFANRMATGKTNAEQMAHAGERVNETALINQAANEPDVPTANRIVAAVGRKVREPFKTNAQGTVLNEETGALNEGGQLAKVVRTNLGAQANQRQAAADGGGAELTPEARTSAAQRYRIDGTLPTNLGRGAQGSKNTVAILNEAAQLAKDAGDSAEEQRIRQIANKASTQALGQLSKQEAMVGAFERNFNKNADLAVAQSNKTDRTGVPALNRWLLAGKKNIAGDEDVAVLDVSMKAVINEYTKIISGSMGNAAMAEGEIKKVTDLLNSAQTPGQVMKVINFMKLETQNRMKGFAEQKAEITRGMRGAPAAEPAPAAPASVLPAGWKIEKVP